MMRAVMTPVLLGVLVTAMVAGGVPAGCSSRPLGHKNVDAAASVPDAPAGGGGVAGSGSEAAAAGSGDNGGVTSSGGSASGGSAGGGSTDARGGIDHLRQPVLISVDEYGLGSGEMLDPHFVLCELGPMVSQRLPHQLVEIQSFALQCEFVARNPGHVEQIVDQASQLPDLPANHDLSTARLFTTGRCVVKDVETVGYGRERIAQFVRKHGQKLVLVAIHLAQSLPGLAQTFFAFLLNLLHPFALRHVAEDHGEMTIIGGHCLNMHPARSAILARNRHVADLLGLASDDLLDKSVEGGATFKSNEDAERAPTRRERSIPSSRAAVRFAFWIAPSLSSVR